MASIVELIVKSKELGSKNIAKVEKSLDNMGKSATKANAKLKKLEGAGKKSGEGMDAGSKGSKGLMKQLTALAGPAVAVGAAVVAAGLAAKKAFDLGREGAMIQQTTESFDRFNESVLKSPSLLADMKKASRGVIKEADLMSGVMTLVAGQSDEMARSFAGAAPRLLEIAGAASKLNPALGDTAFLYESIALGIKRGSPMILDNLGITIKIGEANATYAAELGKTAEQLTASEKQQALLNEVMRSGSGLIQQAGGDANTATDSYDQFTVMLSEMSDTMKVQVHDAIGTLVGDLVEARLEAEKTTDAIMNMGREAGETDLDLATRKLRSFDKEMGTVRRNLMSKGIGAKEALDLLAEAVVEFDPDVETWAEAETALAGIGFAAEDGAVKIGGVVIPVEFLTQALALLAEQAEITEAEMADVALLNQVGFFAGDAIQPLKKTTMSAIELSEAIHGIDIVRLTKQEEQNEKAAIALAVANERAAESFSHIAQTGISLFNEELDELGPKLVTIGGRTVDQNAILSEANEEYKNLGGEIARMAEAPELYGISVDEANEKISEMTTRQQELIPLMERMGSITGTAATTVVEATVNFDALNSTMFDTVLNLKNADGTMAASAEQMAAMGLATGELTKDQAAAIIKQAALMASIKEVTDAFIAGTISAEEATDIITKVGEGSVVSAELAIAEAAAHTLLKDEMNLQSDALDRGKTSAEEADTASDNLATATDEATTASGNMITAQEDATVAIEGAKDETKKADEAARNYAASLDEMSGTYTINVVTKYTTVGTPPQATGGANLPPPPGQEHGGPVTGGVPYLVGEVGPEVFVPPSNGRIIPNNQLDSGQGGNTISITVNGASGNTDDLVLAFEEALNRAGISANERRRII